MSEISIDRVETKADREKFIALPYQLNRGCAFWIPPIRSEERKILDPEKHPFYRHAEAQLFLARIGTRVVGRVAAIADRNAPLEDGRPTGSFGFFESIEEAGVASALVESANGWLRERGMRRMTGPVNPSINYTCGVLVEGFDDPPMVGMTYNRPFYGSLLESAGLRPAKDLLGLRLRLEDLRTPKAKRFAQFALRQPGVRLRPLDVKRMDEEARAIWDLYSRAWKENWGFAAASPEEFGKIGEDLMQFAEPQLIQFCEVEGTPVGLLVVLPDLNQSLARARGRLLPFGWWHIIRTKRTATRARIMLIGMTPEWQSKGLAAAFLSVAGLPVSDRYQQLEASWILEENLRAIKGIEWLGAQVYKRYRLYQTFP